MKKLFITLLFIISLPVYSALPSKYVKIASSSNGDDIYYGNTKDDYNRGSSAWIVTNFKNGQSQISRDYVNCSSKTISVREYVRYSQKDLGGKVLHSSTAYRVPERIIPDTVGEAKFNFICYGIY